MSKIVRYCKLKEEHSGPNAFDVSRPNVMGNPYTHIKDRQTKALVKVKSRDEAIDLYAPYFDMMVEKDPLFKATFDRMYEAYKTYDIVYIGCFCNLNERCHADIIIKKIIQRSMKEKLAQIQRIRKGI